MFILTSFVSSTVPYSVIVLSSVWLGALSELFIFLSCQQSYSVIVLPSVWWRVLLELFIFLLCHQQALTQWGFVKAVCPYFFCFINRLLLIFSYCLVCLVRGFVKGVHPLVSSACSYSVIVLSSVWWGTLSRLFIFLFHQQVLTQLLSCLLFAEGLCQGCSSSCFINRFLFSYCLVVWWGALLWLFIFLFQQQALFQLLSCLLFGQGPCQGCSSCQPRGTWSHSCQAAWPGSGWTPWTCSETQSSSSKTASCSLPIWVCLRWESSQRGWSEMRGQCPAFIHHFLPKELHINRYG